MAASADFLEKARPINILDVMSNELLNRLLNSYCFPLVTALTVYYPVSLPASIESLVLVEPEEVQKKFFFNVCHEYRDFNNTCDQICKNCDKRITLKYYNGEWEGPKLYKCHLRLWDMTYPLYASGQLVGVLFSGQIIVTGTILDWNEELLSEKNEVVWDPFVKGRSGEIPKVSNQVCEVCHAIDLKDEINADQKNILKTIVQKEALKKDMDVRGLLNRYKKFKDFGKTVERLVEDLYTAHAEAARGDLVHSLSKALAEIGDRLAEEKEKFWNMLDYSITSLLPDVKGYALYTLDEYGERIEAVRIKEFKNLKNGITIKPKNLRSLYDAVLNDIKNRGKKPVRYDIMVGSVPENIKKLFFKALQWSDKYSWNACVIGMPLLIGEDRIMGGLICVTAQRETNRGIYKKGHKLSYILENHMTALSSIVSIISMILTRHAIEQQRISSQTIRAHELIAPVHAIQGYQYILSLMFEYDLKGRDYIEKPVIHEFGRKFERLGDLCNLFGRIAASGSLEGIGNYQLVNFEKELILPLVQPLRAYAFEEKRTKVWYSENFSRMPKVWVMKEGIERCLFNIILNAIKYSDRRTKINVGLSMSNDEFKIFVDNKGIGVPREDRENIFRRFKQGSNADEVAAYGSGLGLFVSRTIARKHGGNVELLDGSRDRTRFLLKLPRSLEYEPGLSTMGEY